MCNGELRSDDVDAETYSIEEKEIIFIKKGNIVASYKADLYVKLEKKK